MRRPKPKPCAEPKCHMLAEPGESHCAAHARKSWRGRAERRNDDPSGWRRQARAKRVIRRHGGICHWCGQQGADQADHVEELADGGADDESNMLPIHAACNIEKMRQRQAERRTHPG